MISVSEAIIVGALGIIGWMAYIAWKAGLFQGSSQTSTRVQTADIEALRAELVRHKDHTNVMITRLEEKIKSVEVYQDRDIQELRGVVLVTKNDIEHFKQFKAELRETLRDVEMRIRGGH
jgi:hypothetical protein